MRPGRLALYVVAPLCGAAIAFVVHAPPARPPAAIATTAPIAPATPAPMESTTTEETLPASPRPKTAPEGAPEGAPTFVPHPGDEWLVEHLPYVARGAHYRVQTDVSPEAAQETLAVLERVHPTMVERFREPAAALTTDGLLPVFLYASRRLYDEGPLALRHPWARMDDGSPAWGFYDRRGNAHLIDLPRPVRDRLAVHEAAHQFHHLTSVPLGRAATPKWWVEGVAHDLELAAVPFDERTVDLRRRWLLDAAFRVLHAPGFRLLPLLTGEPLPTGRSEDDRRGLGLVLVRYFRYGEGGRYARWFEWFERSRADGYPVPEFPGLSAGAEALHAEVLRFARTLREGARVTTIRYRRAIDGIERLRTAAGTRGRAPLEDGPREGETAHVRFTLVDPLRLDSSIGVVVGDRGREDHTVVRVDHHAFRVTVERVIGGHRTTRELVPLGVKVRTGGGRYAFAISGDGGLVVKRNGFVIAEGTLPTDAVDGRVGLFARAGDLLENHAVFRLREVAVETTRDDS